MDLTTLIEKSATTRAGKTGSLRLNSLLSAELARLMAGWIPLSAQKIYFLDPFSGTGLLTAAVCDLALQSRAPLKIKADLFEADPARFSLLQQNLATLKAALENAGHEFQVNCVHRNFLEATAELLESPPLFSGAIYPEYDFILASLPDFRLSGLNLPETRVGSGHSDSFTLFLKFASQLLTENGALITLMPRKYGAGLFYKSFRKGLLLKLKPTAFCLLPPEQFSLQVFAEPVLVQFKNARSYPEKIQISAAAAPDFRLEHTVSVPTEEILPHRDPDRVMHIPADALDLELLQCIQSWPLRLDGLGFRAASGKIVPKEVGELPAMTDTAEPWLPVIWAGHLTEFALVFPNPNESKIQKVSDSAAARELSLENQRYVLVHRRHQKNRAYPVLAIYHAPALFPVTRLLLDHEVNYISRQRGKLSLFEALGLMALLNSNLVHRYLTLINGTRPVSTAQLNRLPLPEIEKIIEIGAALNPEKSIDRRLLNRVVSEKLKLSGKLQQIFTDA